MLRRKFFGAAAGAVAAGPKVASYAGDHLRSVFGSPVPVPHQAFQAQKGLAPAFEMSAAEVNPLTALQCKTAKKALDNLEKQERRQSRYRGNAPYYPDIEELRSVSPAAKRVMAADRYLREQRQSLSGFHKFYEILGWPIPSGDIADD